MKINDKQNKSDDYNGIFIRAPGVCSINSDDVTILASYDDVKDGERYQSIFTHVKRFFESELKDFYR